MVMLSWEEKFHAADGKAQACNQGALLFFLSSFGGGEVWGGGAGGEGFFSFFPGSQCVPNVFLLSSQWVPNMLPKFPMCSPTFSP
jgi:hypothetical protein